MGEGKVLTHVIKYKCDITFVAFPMEINYIAFYAR